MAGNYSKLIAKSYDFGRLWTWLETIQNYLPNSSILEDFEHGWKLFKINCQIHRFWKILNMA
jgi:hypothetical protein